MIHAVSVSTARRPLLRGFAILGGLILGGAAVTMTSYAGIGGFGNQQAVGGVMIDAAGVVRSATVAEAQELAQLVRQRTARAEGDLARPTALRMISLRGLQQTIADARAAGNEIPTEVELLVGLQRIEYVFVDPDRQDLVIGGPAEPWQVRDDGAVVGQQSGGATMRLADLMAAMESVQGAADVIRCSIEPTPEGRRRLQQFLRRVKLQPGQNPAVFENAMKQAFGPQTIRLHGVDVNSRFARTLVAADYEMKRIAMGLRPSPVSGLPSYLELSKDSRQSVSENPRWWMACHYDGLTRSADGLAWKLSGQGVRTLTEQELVATDGSAAEAAKGNPLAEQWAASMTRHYAELAREMPVFADLQNLMDLAVVAALIRVQNLAAEAGIDLAVLRRDEGAVQLTSYSVPKAVDPQCSFIHGRAGWTVTASGGVEINAFEVVNNHSLSDAVAETRTAALAAPRLDRWWWDEPHPGDR